MALGSQLREARRRMKLTASEVAAATRMKVQIVEAIEKEDFSKIAAPIYGKGFIRLYAEHVGLKAQPLIREYMERFVEPKVPSLISEDSPPEESPSEPDEGAPPEKAPQQDESLDLFSRIDREPSGKHSGSAVGTARGSGRPNVRMPAWGDAFKAAAEACDRVRLRFTAVIRPAGALPAPEDGTEAPDTETGGRLPLRTISVAVGIIVILIFIASGLSRCIGGAQPENAAELDPEELRLGIDPPAPYFE